MSDCTCKIEIQKLVTELQETRERLKKRESDLRLIRRIADETPEEEVGLPFDLYEAERMLAQRAFEAAGGDNCAAAALLGVARSTWFLTKKRHNIGRQRKRRAVTSVENLHGRQSRHHRGRASSSGGQSMNQPTLYCVCGRVLLDKEGVESHSPVQCRKCASTRCPPCMWTHLRKCAPALYLDLRNRYYLGQIRADFTCILRAVQ